MKLNLREIPEGITHLVVDQPGGSPDLSGFSRIAGRLAVDRSGSVLRITGFLDFVCWLECSRCLQSFSFSGHEEIEIFYRPLELGDRMGGERSLNADDLAVLTYTGNEVDLWPALRETLELSRPLKPLCHEACRGICPGCGRDLNHQDCICPPKPADPRWQALAAGTPAGKRLAAKRKRGGGG